MNSGVRERQQLAAGQKKVKPSNRFTLYLNPAIGKFGVYAYLPEMQITSLRDLRGISGGDV
jgi:hypothetical protein